MCRVERIAKTLKGHTDTVVRGDEERMKSAPFLLPRTAAEGVLGVVSGVCIAPSLAICSGVSLVVLSRSNDLISRVGADGRIHVLALVDEGNLTTRAPRRLQLRDVLVWSSLIVDHGFDLAAHNLLKFQN